MYAEEKCTACGYKGSRLTFSEITIGYNLNDNYHASECEVAEGDLNSETKMLACPICKTIKLTGGEYTNRKKKTRKSHGPDYDKILLKISKIKQEKDLSYEELSAKVGISKSSLQRYLTGNIDRFPLKNVFLLAEALGVTVSEMLGLQEEEE